ncbi:MAG: hypothetical protein RSF93_06060 [Mucinivorans sp.]
MRKALITIVLLAVFCVLGVQESYAQKFVWGAEGGVFVDNAEGSGILVPNNTQSGAWVAPRIGIEFCDSTTMGRHRLMAGFDFTQQFGMPAFGEAPKAQIYYNYRGAKGAEHSFGLLPRSALKNDYSCAFFSSSFKYFNHTIQGAVVSWTGKHVRGEAFFDWFSLNRNDDQEAFMAGGNVESHFAHIFTAEASLYYAHNKLNLDDVFLRDVAGYNALIGVDLEHLTVLDELEAKVGVLGSMNRNRLAVDNAGQWECGVGFNARLGVGYKGFALRDEIFLGSPLSVLWGSAYYTTELYNRVEASWNYTLKLGDIGSINFRAALVLHTTKFGSDFSQKANITLKF